MKLAWVCNRGMHGAGSKKMWFCSHLLAQVPTPLVLLSQALQAALQRVKSTQIKARKKDLFRLYLVQNMCLPPLRNPRLLCKLKSLSIALTLQGSSLGTENECTWTRYLHCTHNTHSTLLRSVCLSLYLQRSYLWCPGTHVLRILVPSNPYNAVILWSWPYPAFWDS